MKNIHLGLMVLLLSFISCNNQVNGQKASSTTEGNSTLLWKISGNGLKTPSYLFGTMHLICESDYFWTPAMENALKSSKKVAFEMKLDDPTIQMKVSAGMLLPADQTLKDYYNDTEYLTFEKFFQKNVGMPLSMVEKMKPMGLLSLLATKMYDCGMPSSYEQNILEKATKSKKEILGLESVEDQINVLNSVDIQASANQMLKMAEEWEEMKAEQNKMVEMYKSQDIVALNQMIEESPDYKDNLEVLLYKRNKNWIPVITQHIKKQPVFIAVGAGHLAGEMGVIQLLRNEGYTVEPIH